VRVKDLRPNTVFLLITNTGSGGFTGGGGGLGVPPSPTHQDIYINIFFTLYTTVGVKGYLYTYLFQIYWNNIMSNNYF